MNVGVAQVAHEQGAPGTSQSRGQVIAGCCAVAVRAGGYIAKVGRRDRVEQGEGLGGAVQGSQAGKGSALVGDGDQAAEQLGREAGAAVGPPGALAGRWVEHQDRYSRVGVGNHRDVRGRPATLA